MKTIIIDGVEYNLTPKVAFREGDWVIDKQGIVHQIANVIKNVTNNTYGYDVVGGGYFNDNTEGVRLWTIEDAKAGDVLAASDGSIFIFKEVVDLGCKHYIALEEENGTIQVNDKFAHCWESVSGACPATKEQRDTLEKAMADAGYTFDFEKKELKKIENEIEIPFGAKDSELQEVTYFIPKGFHAEIDDDKVVIKKGEKSAEWSEEEQQTIKDAASFILSCVNTAETKEEEERLEELADKLQDLRPQNRWKPSDEQMKALNYVVNLIASSASPNENDYYYNVFKDLRKQIKKLREE